MTRQLTDTQEIAAIVNRLAGILDRIGDPAYEHVEAAILLVNNAAGCWHTGDRKIHWTWLKCAHDELGKALEAMEADK